MENTQGLPPEPSESPKSAPNLSESTSKPKNSLTTHYPWLLLMVLFLVPVMVAVFAFNHLSQVEDMGADAPEDIPVVEESVTTTPETSHPTPLWMIIAIALSCATGCLIVFRLLKRSRSKKFLKPNKQVKNSLEPSIKPNSQLLLSNKSSVFPSLTPMEPISENTENLVTVIPPEDSHPLDNETESLAELMDIRKESSLSTILHNN